MKQACHYFQRRLREPAQLMTHVGAIEEVSDGEQRGKDVAQSFVLFQLFHALFQILQRLGYFLWRQRHTRTQAHTSLVLFF